MGPQQQAAWTEIYAQHGQAMRKVAHSMLGKRLIDGKTADDIVSEVLRGLMVKGAPTMNNPRSYLCQAVRNRVNDAQRRHAHIDKDPPNLDKTPGSDNVQHEVEINVLAGAATEALQEIPERERYAIEQRIMLDRPANEVGAELGVAPQRVSQLCNAGIARIRKAPSFIDTGSRDPTGTSAPPARRSETPS